MTTPEQSTTLNAELLDRIESALQRHVDQQAAMRIPVDQTDSDIVLVDLRAARAALAAPLVVNPPEPVAHVHSNGEFCADRQIKSDVWPVPLYTHPVPAPAPQGARVEVQMLTNFEVTGMANKPYINHLHRAIDIQRAFLAKNAAAFAAAGVEVVLPLEPK